ncbi:MAG: rhomboid family intramembrane serine protease [Solirubrobacterales bacterium]|nr:rhomboid family intramembrane serine protease [Solirubrobacterales bacterium]
MAECYRHPGVETGVSCSSCGRPICPDCMTPTPVGMRCPECSREKTRVVSGPTVAAAGGYPATKLLIGLCVLAYLFEIATGTGGISPGSSSAIYDFGLRGIFVADGQWYRLITSGFLHVSIFHLAFNMIALFFLGRILEPSIGTPRFVSIYFASMLAGSFGALLLSGSLVNTVGASGAVFGIFGATFVIARGRGLNHIAREIGVILGINLLLTFTVSGISIGGHLGGLAGGVLCGLIVIAGERGRLGSSPAVVEYGSFSLIALASAVGAVAVSEPPPPGVIIGLSGGSHLPALLMVGWLGLRTTSARRGDGTIERGRNPGGARYGQRWVATGRSGDNEDLQVHRLRRVGRIRGPAGCTGRGARPPSRCGDLLERGRGHGLDPLRRRPDRGRLRARREDRRAGLTPTHAS